MITFLFLKNPVKVKEIYGERQMTVEIIRKILIQVYTISNTFCAFSIDIVTARGVRIGIDAGRFAAVIKWYYAWYSP